jgi:hypothetical protein
MTFAVIINKSIAGAEMSLLDSWVVWAIQLVDQAESTLLPCSGLFTGG